MVSIIRGPHTLCNLNHIISILLKHTVLKYEGLSYHTFLIVLQSSMVIKTYSMGEIVKRLVWKRCVTHWKSHSPEAQLQHLVKHLSFNRPPPPDFGSGRGEQECVATGNTPPTAVLLDSLRHGEVLKTGTRRTAFQNPHLHPGGITKAELQTSQLSSSYSSFNGVPL